MQTNQQTNLDNQCAQSGQCPASLHRFLNGETADPRRQREHEEAREHVEEWQRQDAARRLETTAKVAGAVALAVFVIVVLWL